MSQVNWMVRVAAMVLMTAACSQQPVAKEKLTMQGTVSQELYASNLKAVAIGEDGRSFWAALDAKGDFKLVVPVGQSYRVVLARSANGASAVVARLALSGAAGKTPWIGARAGGTLRLGDLVPAGANVATPAKSDPTALGVASRGEHGGDSDDDHDSDSDDAEDDRSHADDPECEEKEEASVCVAPDATEVECSRNGSAEVSESGDWSSAAPSQTPCEPSSSEPDVGTSSDADAGEPTSDPTPATSP